LTFVAYIDFVAKNDELRYCTVDTDYGCGVIQKSRDSGVNGAFLLRDLWSSVRNDPYAAFQFVQKWKYTLLNLVPVERFVRTEAETVLMR